jgi:FMN phosphatase YigB (HAD superfamily)
MPGLTFWIDVDNTLLDNDHVKEDLDRHIRPEIGSRLADRFWQLYEEVRHTSGVVNIPQALERLRATTSESELDEQTFLHVRSLFEHYPFVEALYPQALETLAYLRTLGLTVIVSDGDQVFQAEKILTSTLAEAVEGRVLIYDHKQRHLEETMQRYPADHYVAIDDRLDILADLQGRLGTQLTSVFVKQGKYAAQAAELAPGFQADITVEHIADLQGYSAARLLGRSA